MNGLEVVLIDRDQESADKGKANCDQLISGQVSQRPRDGGRQGSAAGADRGDAGLRDVSKAAISSSRLYSRTARVKAEATKRAQEVVGPDVVFASNTSTLPITSLAQTSLRPENFIGIHFFSPVEKMLLVEII